MSTTLQFEKLKQALDARAPLIGAWKRRSAIRTLCEHRHDPQAVGLLAGALDHQDHEVAALAAVALRDLGDHKTAIDALCEVALQNPGGKAARRLCLEKGYRPSDPERACLFLFVTNQLDAYFQEDYEFQNLRLQFEKADAGLKARVMEVVRSGDRRCLPFVVRPRKALHECTEAEIKLAIESCLRHQDWDRLFTACLELPLKYSFPALDPLRTSGWEPQSPELKSLYHQLLADSKGQVVSEPHSSNATSTVFERWLARGREPQFTQASEADLVQRLGSVNPPEGVSIVAALAAKGKCSEATVHAVRGSDHWLIRLAGLATGLTRDLLTEPAKDSNYWVNELAGAAGVLEFWPGKATPADLDRLKAAPPEAFVGKLGAARKVLRSIMGYRITTGVFEEMFVEAGATDAEFVEAEPS
ncbi:MAG: hypothetical protein KBE65_22200 [Phycisphaerae bacterium]|nr:hypothetical protein [Phycisphaerae bacterium]